ncbi:MAG: hypothetical protein HY293_06030 [Planctomycetes bacterium]|nr:hypothetical protein [Planctomycetota bacterium]
MKLLLALAVLASDGEIVEDFENAALDGWERVVSDDHPPYNSIATVHEPGSAKSGTGFLRMRSLGGSTSLRLLKPWPVDASRPYRLSFFARTPQSLGNAASVTLAWLDAGGARIAETRSLEVARAGDWMQIVLEIPRVPAGAVGVSPRLDFGGGDVSGYADFDRLSFTPVQRLDLRPSGRPTAVFSPEEYPRLTVSLAGAPPGTYGVTVVMRTAAGAEHRRSAVLTNFSATVDFPPPLPGAHEVAASVDGTELRRSLTLLVPNPWPSTAAPKTEIPTALYQAAVRGPLLEADGDPTPSWLALRALHDAIDGATLMADPGLFPANVRSLAFRKQDSAVLALWCDRGDDEIPITLNDGARLYPSLGALRPLKPGERIRLSPIPVYIVGIDPLLLELKLEIAGGDLPLQLNPATRTIRFRNPSRAQALRDVRIRLEELPAGWQASPRAISAAALAADADLTGELQFTLPVFETPRVQELRFEVGFVRNGKEQTIHLTRFVRLSPVFVVDSAVTDGPQAGSKKVTLRIRNASDHPMTLALRARLPSLPEQNELLRDLAPGAASAPFTYVVKDVFLLDPGHATAEIEVRESTGGRAAARKVVPLR